MSDKTLSKAELELTQKVQMHFPRGIIPSEILKKWNGCPKEYLTARLIEIFFQSPNPLLRFLRVVSIPVANEKFVARDRFVLNIERSALVKISGLGNKFREGFLDKVEKPIKKTKLHCHKLLRAGVDGQIIAELGGEERAETTLVEIWSLLKRQGNGDKEGVLLTNNYANIFYVRDYSAQLLAVHVRWLSEGWYVNAHSVEYTHRWNADHQVFSPIN